ncbi:carbonic anhydrase [Pseudoxanthomonas mexicana]|uniref:carbonic anhydrase n=1 Tax=Pseudoxanthomonas mexicana TaxID=128785 RepID=UPI00398B6F21
MKLTGSQALRRLREGNRRFHDGLISLDSLASHVRRRELSESQDPIAIVLGCSDSRAPAEMVFDQGLGDLFVIRVAGNIAAPSQIASIEFAAAAFGTRLVVVLGHSGCGAVRATLDCLCSDACCSPALHAIVDRIRPAVEPLLDAEGMEQRARLMAASVRANVRASIAQIRNGSAILQSMIDAGELLIVGAEYSLDSGQVDFFENPEGDDDGARLAALHAPAPQATRALSA